MASAGSSPRSGRPIPAPTRSARRSGRARSQTTVPLALISARFSGLSTAPPATDRTVEVSLRHAVSSTCASARRKAASPSRSKSAGTVNPVSASTSASESR